MKRLSLDFTEDMMRHAIDIAGWQLEAVEREMQEQGERYPEYAAARARMASAESALMDVPERYRAALDTLIEANTAYAAALAIEMYLRGTLDGGRVYHAFTSRELPMMEVSP